MEDYTLNGSYILNIEESSTSVSSYIKLNFLRL